MNECRRCRRLTQHESWCTGGCKLKTYLTSFDGRDWSGDVEYMAPVEATYADGTPVHEASGLRTDNNFAVNFADRIGEKKERRMSDLARKEGRAPLHFHKSGSRRPQKKEA